MLQNCMTLTENIKCNMCKNVFPHSLSISVSPSFHTHIYTCTHCFICIYTDRYGVLAEQRFPLGKDHNLSLSIYIYVGHYVHNIYDTMYLIVCPFSSFISFSNLFKLYITSAACAVSMTILYTYYWQLRLKLYSIMTILCVYQIHQAYT